MVYYRRKVSLTAFFLYKEKIKAPRTWQLHHQGQSVTTVTVQRSPSVNVESMCQPQHTDSRHAQESVLQKELNHTDPGRLQQLLRA